MPYLQSILTCAHVLPVNLSQIPCSETYRNKTAKGYRFITSKYSDCSLLILNIISRCMEKHARKEGLPFTER